MAGQVLYSFQHSSSKIVHKIPRKATIELDDGTWAAIEIKTGEDKVPAAVENLTRLRKKVAANPAARNPRPAFAAVLTATSPFARYDREHDVYVFPLSALRP